MTLSTLYLGMAYSTVVIYSVPVGSILVSLPDLTLPSHYYLSNDQPLTQLPGQAVSFMCPGKHWLAIPHHPQYGLAVQISQSSMFMQE